VLVLSSFEIVVPVTVEFALQRRKAFPLAPALFVQEVLSQDVA